MAAEKRMNLSAPAASSLPRGWSEFLGVALLAIGALVMGGLLSYQFGDGGLMGPVGRLIASALYAGFGMAGYLLALGVLGLGIKALLGWEVDLTAIEGIGFAAATMAGCALLHVTFPDYRLHGYTAGGLGGELLGEVSIGLFSLAGTYVVAVAVLVVGLLASTPLTPAHLLAAGRVTLGASHKVLTMAGRTASGWLAEAWRAARPGAGERALDDRDDDARAADYDDDDAEDADDDDGLDEDDDAGGDALDEDEDGEDEAGEQEDAQASARASSGRARGRAPKAAAVVPPAKLAAGQARKNRKLTRDEPEAAQPPTPAKPDRAARSEDATEHGVDTQATQTPAATLGPAAGRGRPEIVLPSVIGADAADAKAGADGGDESANELGAAAKAARGKKAPPRPEELAQGQRAPGAAPQSDPTSETDGAGSGADVAAVQARRRPKRGAIVYLDGAYRCPSLELFHVAETAPVEVDKDFVYAQAQQIERALAHFRIKGEVTHIHPGPVITRYEFKPEAGVKVARIQNLENDLAMALEALRIRILAPIPGKSTVGLEVPNKQRETVYIQEILGDEAFGAHGRARLPLGLGKSITGKPEWLDLAKAPHLLVAGATGSGKSVGVNTMICSLLYTCSPDDVRMILIDPKMLEFSVYADIPHLLLPVITDAEKANLALRWAVNEMERRYALLSEARVRNIEGYNERLPEMQAEWDAELALREDEAARESGASAALGEDALDGRRLSGVSFDAQGQASLAFGGSELPDRPTKLPYIVVIIDEFADLMAVASKEVESNVARIAAKARAAGIHLIVATQRPSVDVITGTIKNNFPSRVAFQVTSEVDSRTILDSKGAKQLLGNGDMLYMDRGKEAQRIHGCFVSEREIERVVSFIKKQARPCYDTDITAAIDATQDGDEDEPRMSDPLYDKAVQIVAETQKVSTSMIQRRLGIGYNRAAKIVEAMEAEGVIGPSRGTTPREVFVSAA